MLRFSNRPTSTIFTPPLAKAETDDWLESEQAILLRLMACHARLGLVTRLMKAIPADSALRASPVGVGELSGNTIEASTDRCFRESDLAFSLDVVQKDRAFDFARSACNPWM